MQHTTAWNFAPTDKNRLTGLLQYFGCADIVAPLDADAFSRRTGEVISLKQWKAVTRNKPKTVTRSAGKYRLVALQCEEVAAQTHDPYAKDMLTIAARKLRQAAEGLGL